jgi:hypothetical protein
MVPHSALVDVVNKQILEMTNKQRGGYGGKEKTQGFMGCNEPNEGNQESRTQNLQKPNEDPKSGKK